MDQKNLLISITFKTVGDFSHPESAIFLTDLALWTTPLVLFQCVVYTKLRYTTAYIQQSNLSTTCCKLKKLFGLQQLNQDIRSARDSNIACICIFLLHSAMHNQTGCMTVGNRIQHYHCQFNGMHKVSASTQVDAFAPFAAEVLKCFKLPPMKVSIIMTPKTFR